MIPKKTVVIVDDHPLFREGLKSIIRRDTRYEIVGEAGNGHDAMQVIGEQRPDLVLFSYWLPILVAYLVVTVGRGLIIVSGRALMGLTRERFPWRWSVVLTWGGLRGALPMVLVLSLPSTFAYRDLLVSMTFGVAVLSILVHGLTMSWLLTRLGIVSESADRTAYELRSGQLQAAAAAVQELDRMAQMHLAAPEILSSLRDEYRRTVESTEEEMQKLAVSRPYSRDLYRIRRRLLVTERDQVMRAYREGALGRKSQERLLADIDARLVRLESGDTPPEAPAKDEETDNG